MKAWTFISVLFTGYKEITSIRSPKRETLAFVRGGLCFYMGVLPRLSDKPEEMFHTFIIPGCIETRTGRLYDALNSTTRFNVPVFNYDASPTAPCFTLPEIPRPSRGNYEVSAVVEETMIDLTTHFIVKKSSNMSVICSPGALISRLHKACGEHRVACLGQDCPELDIAGLSLATIEGEGAFKDQILTKAGCKIGLRLVADDSIARLLALMVDRTYGEDVPCESQSRSREVARDGWLDYGAPNVSPMDGDREELRQENLENDQLPAAYEADEANSGPTTPIEINSEVILQRGECLPCTIRKAVAITGSEFQNVYVVCR